MPWASVFSLLSETQSHFCAAGNAGFFGNTQASIQKQIRTYVTNEDWGDRRSAALGCPVILIAVPWSAVAVEPISSPVR